MSKMGERKFMGAKEREPQKCISQNIVNYKYSFSVARTLVRLETST